MDEAKLSDFIKQIAIASQPRPFVLRALALCASEDSTLPDLKNHIVSNQAYTQSFLRLDLIQERLKSWTEEDPKRVNPDPIFIERIIGLMGKQAARNVLAAIRMNRIQNLGLPKKEKDKFLLNIKDLIKFSLQAEDFCQTESLAFSQNGFAAGLHYDCLNAVITRAKLPKDVKKTLEVQFKTGIKVGRIAYGLVTQLKNFSFDHYVFAAGLLSSLDKVLMSISFPKEGNPSFQGFLSEMEKLKNHKTMASHYFERKQFPLFGSELTSVFVNFLQICPGIEKALFFMPFPYYLRTIDPKSYQLSLILNLARVLSAGGHPDSLPPHLIALAAELKINALQMSLAQKKGLGAK